MRLGRPESAIALISDRRLNLECARLRSDMQQLRFMGRGAVLSGFLRRKRAILSVDAKSMD